MFGNDKSKLPENGEGSNKPEWQLLEKIALASTVEQRKARRWGIFFKLLTFAYLFFIFAALTPASRSVVMPAEEDHVALVAVEGIIAANSEANANTVVTGLRAAFEAERSKAIIVAINSPGGSPVQSGYINDEINRLRELHPEKKVYAVIADIGASGGYYVASAADEIYADKASLVGSIGVISAGFGVNGLLEKIGVDRRVYTSGESKNFLDMFSAERDQDREFWQGVLNVTHNQFIDVVKRGRGDRLLDDPEIFSGLIWTGEQAVEKGLIDGLGSAGYVAREVVGYEDIRDYTVTVSPFEEFAKKLGASFSLGLQNLFSQQVM